MTAMYPSRSDWSRRLIGELRKFLQDFRNVDVPDGFAEQYVRHLPEGELVDLDPSHVATLIAEHLRLGQQRRPGESLVRLRLPEQPGASAVLLIVTDDQPFLVDTVSLDITRTGWSIRTLFHPQYEIVRDPDGRLTGIGDGRGDAESWICVEVFPPLGQAAADRADALTKAIASGLAAVRAAVDDWAAMKRRLTETIDWINDNPQPVSPHGVREVTDLLQWLTEGNFVLLGYRESHYTKADGFRAVPGTGLGILRGADGDTEFQAAPTSGDRGLLVLTKDSRRSPVHRGAYLDYIGVRRYDGAGRLTGERRFLGLFAATAYGASVWEIPVLARKAQKLLDLSGFDPHSHGGSAIRQVIDSYPRDELFQATAEELFPVIAQEAQFKDRRVVRLFVRRGTYGRFISVLVFLPRDRYTTDVREAIQRILVEALGGESLEHQARVTESVLARLFFVVKRPDDDPLLGDIDEAALLAAIEAAVRSWDDDFEDAARDLASESRGVEFSDAYKEEYRAGAAVLDLRLANRLAGDDDLGYDVYRPAWPGDGADVRFKVLGYRQMSLAEAMPHLSVLGVEVLDERPFEFTLRGRKVYLYDFGLRVPGGTAGDWTPALQQRFVDTFDASYRGYAESGKFNRLVMTAGLTWQEIAWLRAISRYLVQAGIPYSQPYVAATLNDNPAIAAALVGAFRTKFDPTADFADAAARGAAVTESFAGIESALAEVASLDADRILRMFLAVLRAMIRTNAFQPGAPAHAFKVHPRELPLLPEPRPMYEIFVYSPRVQGVHLRFGRVARGGLRWSDRREDFRTEVLGLVKAQMVKNSVIVPSGAKGGFVPQSLPDPGADRAAWLAEGVACYQVFIASLLTLTDNIVDGAVVPPPSVVRWDDDDPSLVVAAAQGTATFSDPANTISLDRGFWLGDAFASGGSAGYDHKAMGITARGAWESVKRHFIELGRDCQAEDFTCVGIGDMAGDVFGNGMLRSRHTRLVAAFNHLHVFLDPNPDAERSFAERERLFRLPRSSWADYDPALISPGGGVFPRTLKSVPISAEARAALGLDEGVTRLTPAELINAILKAPVDLLWNGGIGTYVKASGETNADVGDKANDAVRVNGAEVRALCAGEGGNLGWTQLGRIEYAVAGGRINTDFIDNSAGVDTSDHEVNIKILLAPEVVAGGLDLERRNELLASMTDEVAELVLAHNVNQNLALSNSMYRGTALTSAYEGWMHALEEAGYLDREIEFLPTARQLETRRDAGRGLTRPELATLLAWTKIYLTDRVLASDLPDDPYLADRLIQYFPKELQDRYAAGMPKHRLAREINTTVAVNRFVNSQGITAYHRLHNETNAAVTDVIRAQLAARSIYQVGRSEVDLGRASELSAPVVTELRVALRRMVERATRWLLNHRHGSLDITATVAEYGAEIAQLRPELLGLLSGRTAASSQAAEQRWLEAGLPEELARNLATAGHAHTLLNVVDVAHRLDCDLLRAAQVHYRVAEALGIELLSSGVDVLPRQVRWDAMARAALRDELLTAHTDLTAAVLTHADAETDAATAVQTWLDAHPGVAPRVAMIRQVSDGTPDVARMNVGLSQLRAMLCG